MDAVGEGRPQIAALGAPADDRRAGAAVNDAYGVAAGDRHDLARLHRHELPGGVADHEEGDAHADEGGEDAQPR